MRVALAGLFEEVNTFAAETMGLATITGNMTTGFQEWSGQALIDESEGTKTYMGGFLAALQEFPDVEIVPLVLWSFSAGPAIERGAYQQMKQDILDKLAAAMPLDAIALQMHGAGIAEGVDDVEGDLAAAIRQQVGDDVKLICVLDHHSNVTDAHLKQMDLITTVLHYPHEDMYDAAYRAAKLIPDLVKGTIKPHGHFEHLPFLMQLYSTLDGNAFAPIRQRVEEFAKRDGIYEFSFFYGFAFADVAFNTATVNCWAKSAELAASTAKEFAAWVWEHRQEFVVKTIGAADAVQKAIASLAAQGRTESPQNGRSEILEDSVVRLARADEELTRSSGFVPDSEAKGPIVIAEKSDNPGGGAPGDATNVLHELINNDVRQVAVCAVRDADTVQKALAAGVGSTIDVELGGKLSKQGGAPVQGKAYVKTISDGRYTVVSPMGRGTTFDVGPAVGLLIEGIDVAVVTGLMQAFDHGQMRLVGFDPRDYRIVVVKSANHFRAWWTAVASEIIDCDPPGLASNDLGTFTFKNKVRKVFPLDADAAYPESEWTW